MSDLRLCYFLFDHNNIDMNLDAYFLKTILCTHTTYNIHILLISRNEEPISEREGKLWLQESSFSPQLPYTHYKYSTAIFFSVD